MAKAEEKLGVGKPRWGVLGAVVTALLASLCCVGPLVLVLLGVGGAWMSGLAVFQPYRVYLMIASAGFLGYAFYRTYRSAEEQDCAPGSYCTDRPHRRRTKIVLWAATAVVAILFALPYVMPPFVARRNADSTEVSMSTVQATLRVENMTCSGCVATVTRVLSGLDGVRDVKVTLDPPKAVVLYDSSKLGPEDLTRATARAGYPSALEKEAQ